MPVDTDAIWHYYYLMSNTMLSAGTADTAYDFSPASGVRNRIVEEMEPGSERMLCSSRLVDVLKQAAKSESVTIAPPRLRIL